MTDQKADRQQSSADRHSRREEPDRESRLRRPDEEIANRPRLKVKPLGNRKKEKKRGPKLRGGTPCGSQQEGQEKEDGPEPEERSEKQRAAKVTLLPRRETDDGRYPYATYREAPEDDAAEEQELEAVSGQNSRPEVSTGFLLGLALIGVVLVGGILLARLGNKVARLERRVSAMEKQTGPETAEAPRSP